MCMQVADNGRLTVAVNGQEIYVGYPQLFPNYNHINNINNNNNNQYNNINDETATFLSIHPSDYPSSSSSYFSPIFPPYNTLALQSKLTPYTKLLADTPCVNIHQYLT